jgi:glycosyltransferase involved in cell wall biosynthesis
MLIDSFLAGGAERIAVEVACGLDRDRFEPMVIATRSGGPLQDKLQSEGIPYVILGRKRGFSPLKLLKAHRAIAGADILHAHKYGSNMWGALLARTTRVPFVVREPTFNGVRSKRRSIGYRYWVAQVARHVICPTEVVARSLTADGFSRSQIRVIPNGVPLDAAVPRTDARAELGIDAQARVVGIVARLRLEKAHEVLFRAIARIAGSHPDLRLAVVGDGSRRDELAQLGRELGIEDVLVWAGERRDARRIVSAFDIGVICSSWEGLPVAALETMAAGVPLVATRVGTMPEVLAGGAGALVAVGDDRGLADTLAFLLDDLEEARKIGARGRERIRRDHAFERMIEEFVEVYDEVGRNRLRPGRRARLVRAN